MRPKKSPATISQPGEIETGQNLKLTMAMDASTEERHRLLLEDITDTIDINAESLADKRVMVSFATAMIGFAFVLLGLAQPLPVL